MADDAEDIARRLAEQHGLRFIDLTQSSLAPGAASLLPETVARRHHVVPIGRRLGTPVIAVADPGDLFAMDALRTSVGREFVAVVARSDQVAEALARLYPGGNADADADADGGAGATATADDGAQSTEEDTPAAVAVADPAGDTEVEDIEQRVNGNGAVAPADVDIAGDLAAADVSADGDGMTGESSNGHQGSGAATGMTFDEMMRTDQGATLEDMLADSLTAPTEAETADAAVAQADGAFGVDDGVADAPASNGATPLAADLEAPAQDDAIPPPPPEYQQTAESSLEIPPAPEGYGVVSESPGTGITFQGPPLARVLVEMGRVSAEDMTRALHEHEEAGESLARYLYSQHLATEEDLVWAMAQEVGLEYVDLNAILIDRAAASLIPESTARHHVVLPIGFEDGVPIVAMANPTDVFAMDDLRTIMGRNFKPVVATRSQIINFLRFSADTEIDVSAVAQDAAGASGDAPAFELESLQAVVEDAPIVRYVNLLILQALNERASDIHVEPTPRRLRIRFRIDGVMHDATSASSSIANAVVSRLKVLGDMDITEHRVPLEGRVSLSVSDRQIDLRIATLPSLYGEAVVMRLLDKSAAIRTLPELGFLPNTLERYSEAYSHPYGVILVTGPTGAGKTTTLYATLQEVQSSEKSVVTVEDPVEYQIDGITQVQINKRAGLLYSTALKSILRADPDIVLIGEIRDADTATMAMEAALSGHLVLSTLHTNTAAATPLRLTEMGIEPFLVTSAVGSVLTQRLARVLCNACKDTYDATEKDFVAAGYHDTDLEGVDTSSLYRAVGCRLCSHTGYLGRMVLAEVMNMTEELDRMIIEQAPIVNIERAACEQGMQTLRQDGLVKAISGQTTLEEVLRVVV
jgi:type IV pilus assembly protein PilB